MVFSSQITSRDLGLKPNTGSFGNSAASAVVGAAGDVLLNRALPGFNFLVGSATTPRGILTRSMRSPTSRFCPTPRSS